MFTLHFYFVSLNIWGLRGIWIFSYTVTKSSDYASADMAQYWSLASTWNLAPSMPHLSIGCFVGRGLSEAHIGSAQLSAGSIKKFQFIGRKAEVTFFSAILCILRSREVPWWGLESGLKMPNMVKMSLPDSLRNLESITDLFIHKKQHLQRVFEQTSTVAQTETWHSNAERERGV